MSFKPFDNYGNNYDKFEPLPKAKMLQIDKIAKIVSDTNNTTDVVSDIMQAYVPSQPRLSYKEMSNLMSQFADNSLNPQKSCEKGLYHPKYAELVAESEAAQYASNVHNTDDAIRQESRTTYINILDFSTDETFVPTVFIKNDEARELMVDAFSRIGSTVSMEKTNIKYEKPKVELQCMNQKKYDPNDALLLYAIGNKIHCANRDIYLSDVGELVNAVNLLVSVTNNKLAQLRCITNRSSSLLLQANEYKPTVFNIPQIFVEPDTAPTNNNIKPYNDGNRFTPFKFNEQTNIPLSLDPVATKVAPYYVKPVTDNNSNPGTKGADLNIQRFKFNELVDNKTTYYVYINTHEYSTFVQTDDKFKSLFNKYPEYGFQLLIEYKTNNNDIASFLKTMFDNKTFTNKDDVENQLLNASKYIIWCNDVASQNKDTTEYEIVKQYINHLFVVDPSSDSKHKATDIFSLFESKQEYLELTVDTNFRNRLSKYLLNMGLHKKRLSDGYYYYGLIRRE